ncbi:MAG: FAD-dependent oxidoreductase [Candidatus Sericytochromatia bacterium]
MKINKVAIIGGGLAGLSSAILLAKSGIKVSLFEKSNTLGGRARTTDDDGIMFNLGAHALYNAGEAKKILTELGVNIKGSSPEIGGYVLKNNELNLLPANLYSLFTSKIIKSYRSKFELSKILMSLPFIDLNNTKNISIEEWIDQNIKSEDVKELFYALVRLWTYSNNYTQNAYIVLQQAIKALKDNVTYIDYGWQSLIKQLEEIALKLGVDINTGSKIDKVVEDKEYSNIIFKNSLSLNFDYIIFSISPNEILSLLDNEKIKEYVNEVKPIKVSCLDLALEKLPNPNISFILGIDKDIYYSVHSKYAFLSKNNKTIVHLIKYLSNDNEAKNSLKDFENLMDIVQPDWEKYIIKQRFLPKMIVSNNIYPSSGKRPNVKLEGTSNIYICGDWVGNKGLLADASLSSSIEATNIIKEKILIYR